MFLKIFYNKFISRLLVSTRDNLEIAGSSARVQIFSAFMINDLLFIIFFLKNKKQKICHPLF